MNIATMNIVTNACHDNNNIIVSSDYIYFYFQANNFIILSYLNFLVRHFIYVSIILSFFSNLLNKDL